MDYNKELHKLKEDIDNLRRSHIGLQESHIKIQLKVYGDESKEIYEEEPKCKKGKQTLEEHEKNCDFCLPCSEDNWNLADKFKIRIMDSTEKEFNINDPRADCVDRNDLKTFIQKVKEDIEKERGTMQDINRIIDKRAGDLKWKK